MGPNIVQPNYQPWAGSPAYRDRSTITDFIIHHGDDAPSTTPLEIDAQHRSQGWDGIGYTWIIGEDGTIYQGRPIEMVPAAAQDRNTVSVDVCLTGDFQPGTAGYAPPTAAQLASLRQLCLWAHYQIPSIERTIGHRDVAAIAGDPSVATACPGDTLYAEIPAIRAYVQEDENFGC